ncbi:/ truB / tRNA pseudouridine synthase B /:185638 Forward [Candidatus Hepatoplasma crinochetorum]|uniref:tRNA pseudouridine synthase B n=1 Tax=Candidatus Hepatoplasma crinochetorum TaxID=295596 RepID=A0A0G7ZM90_9MOLU|nr:/ truB / tRNA pseudouridine synthase B /:185638 Forward [Candidatus Hepatoplasma crinochetorum]
MDRIFIAFKEEGISSNKFIQKLKKELNVNKIGHAGTLDPFASGLLLIGTENYTKLLNYFKDLDKTYVGTILFGKETDTFDKTGKIIKEEKVNINFELLKKIIKDNFIGKIEQKPPLYSAIKIKGISAYKYAQKGLNLELIARERFIYYFKIYRTEKQNEFTFEIKVSSGTYIRAIARDLAIKLNTVAILTSLRRIKIFDLKLEDQKMKEISDPYKFLNIEKILLSDQLIKNLLNGKLIEILGQEKQILIALSHDHIHEILVEKIRKGVYKIKKRIK